MRQDVQAGALVAPTMISPRGTRSISAIATIILLRASSVSSTYF